MKLKQQQRSRNSWEVEQPRPSSAPLLPLEVVRPGARVHVAKCSFYGTRSDVTKGPISCCGVGDPSTRRSAEVSTSEPASRLLHVRSASGAKLGMSFERELCETCPDRPAGTFSLSLRI